MRRPILIALMIASLAGASLAQVVHAPYAHAQDAIDQNRADTFDKNMFTRPPGDKAFACFMRRYDAEHLAKHPRQKVAAMKLLVTAEIPEGEKQLAYSFNVGVKFRHRAGGIASWFGSLGYCNHAIAEDDPNEIRFACGVDCEGGGINVALSKDDNSAIVRLERIVVWKNNRPGDDDEAELAGADDKIFRLDRVDNGECASLLTDREELAALRQK
ncbi:MAG TPA: hypothetical protein VKY22_09305 [Bradyrhizobium sp.]|nr:hypothetical protein [Bradyrhizobium sp.]